MADINLRLARPELRLMCEPPMALPDTGDRRSDVQLITQATNDTLERRRRAAG